MHGALTIVPTFKDVGLHNILYAATLLHVETMINAPIHCAIMCFGFYMPFLYL